MPGIGRDFNATDGQTFGFMGEPCENNKNNQSNQVLIAIVHFKFGWQ